ncbi:MAG TPA: membrane protein insertase YidC [Bacteroidia bacterium]|jgi:YidC/Oxa1 family membrane protein insertase
MDRNSIIGLLLIGGILVGWMVFTQPNAAEKAKLQHAQDSIAQYTLTQQEAAETQKKASETQKTKVLTASLPATGEINDSVRTIIKKQIYGPFYEASKGENKNLVLENELMKVNVSTKGGRISSVELKNYKTYDGKPLILFYADSSQQSLVFESGSKKIATDTMFFTTEGTDIKVEGETTKELSLRMYAGDKSKYIEYIYSIKGNDYMMGYRINVAGMQNIISSATKNLTLNLQMKAPVQEKHHETQTAASTIYFQDSEGAVDKISETSEEKLTIETPAKWIGFKQQFFTSAFIADNHFAASSTVETKNSPLTSEFVKDFSASLLIPYNHTGAESFGMRVYFGPNHYQTLKKYDLDLERQINLGWKIFGWINRFLVIPIFNFLSGFNMNYGMIILVLTIILKLLLLPIAYRTVLSSAKMRVLKPEVDELNEKHKNDDPMKKQQATMALYKKAGVNPMAGCIPVLLQMPILMALFSFFPASIELRQQGFLWAHDLSTYDSVYNFGFSIPWYGDHVSLFALLMTASTLLYTWSNSQLMGTSNQMPGMKWMMYLMPILFLGFLNNYSAGLSWYYFLANMITFGQTWFMQKYVIDSDALHRKIQENKTKPVKVSKFQQRLEAMTKEAQARQGQKKK